MWTRIPFEEYSLLQPMHLTLPSLSLSLSCFDSWVRLREGAPMVVSLGK